MKRKIVFHDNINKKTTTTEVEIPDKSHLDAQIRFKAQVFKPKKGKGSFKRKSKYKNLEENQKNCLQTVLFVV